MIEYTTSTSREECITLASQLDITLLQSAKKNRNLDTYNYQKDLLLLLSELNLIEYKINKQRHCQLESILSSKKEINKSYIQLIIQHNSINLDILNIREQVYNMLSNI